MAAMRAKAMKAMRAKRVSKIAFGKRAKIEVFAGRKEKTHTGLTKADLMKTKTGRIVTQKAHAAGKKAYAFIKGWHTAFQKARDALGVKGFQAVKKGEKLYNKTRAIYRLEVMGWTYRSRDDTIMHNFSGQVVDFRKFVVMFGDWPEDLWR